MATRPPKLGGLVAVLGFSLSCVGLLIFLWSSFGGPIPLKPTGYQFTAYYRDATQLIAQTDVRMAGVDVGHVVGVAQQGELTRAEVEIEPQYAPISTDTTTVLRRKTLLGEPFIQLIPGTPEDQGGTLLAENGTLPVGQTQTSVELDEALRAFDPPTRKNLRLIFNELAKGTESVGSDLNGALGNLRPVTESGANVSEVLAARHLALRTLIHDGDLTLEAFSARQGDLRELNAAGNEVLAATATRDRALAETVELLPATLRELRPTLDLARAVGLETDPLLREIEPASRQLTPALRDLHDLAPELRGLLVDTGPFLDAAPTGIPAFTNTLAAARPLMRQLRPALQDVVPVVEWATDYKREVAAWLVKLGMGVQSSAGAEGKHILRTTLPMTPEGLGIWNNPLPTNRHNPYAKPGYLDDVGNPHVRAFDCQNEGPDLLGFAPPCVEQGPFNLKGFSGTFPQLHKAP